MNAAERSLRFYCFIRVVTRFLFSLWNRFSARGLEHIPANGGVIIAANHVSYLDPPAIGSAIPHRVVRFMARDTLFKPGFGTWLLNNLAVIPIMRGKGDLAALRTAIQVLKSGGCLGLFPEGTRSLDGNLQTAKGGIGFLIAKAGVPVVPTYIDGSFAAYPKGAGFIRPKRIRIVFGAPILPEEVAAIGTDRDCYDRIAALVMERIARLRDSLSTASSR